MRILLTGATGFVGSHAAHQLAAAGHDLRLLTRPSSDLRPLDGLAYERHVADLRVADGLAVTCEGMDAVVHVAGVISAARDDTFARVNAAGTAALAEAAARAGVRRFLYVSSLAALGPSAAPEPPDTPVHPVTAYGRSKAEGERAALAQAGPMEVQILRPPAVYGPRDTGLLPFFRMARWRFITRFGDGRNRVAMIYGPDVGGAIRALLERAEGPSPFFHVSDSDGPYTWRELIAALGQAFGRRVWSLPVPPLAFDAVSRASVALAQRRDTRPLLDRSRFLEMRQPIWACDHAALTAHTGWAPPTALAVGLRDTVDWYRRHGWI